MTSPKDTICIHRWQYPVIGIAKSEFRMCCKTPVKRGDDSEDFYINSPYEKARRLEMLQGVRHSDCNQCWRVEDAGGVSMRMNRGSEDAFKKEFYDELLNEFGTIDLDAIATQVTINSKILESNTPSKLEISLNNTCDLQCVYCSPHFSSQWATDLYKDGKIDIQTMRELSKKTGDEQFQKKVWEWMGGDVKYSLTGIGIIGGEPTVTPEFYNFMDRLLTVYNTVNDKTTRHIWIVTNLNTPENYFNKFIKYVEQLSNKFKIDICVSADTVYKKAEYIRTNLIWDRFENNLHKLLSIKNVNVIISATVSALSLPYTLEFLKWHNSLETQYHRTIEITENSVVYPEALSPLILPSQFAAQVQHSIEYLEVSNIHTGYIKFLKGIKSGLEENRPVSNKILKDFVYTVNKFNKKGNGQFNEVFPELVEFYNYCKNLN